MSRLLLDTHALLWALLSPHHIPPETLNLLRTPSTQLFVSAASAWEIGIKHRLGRLEGASALVDGYGEHLRRLGAEELPISSTHALLAGTMSWDHRDPFDRMIATQCILESIPLATADRELSAFPAIRVVW